MAKRKAKDELDKPAGPRTETTVREYDDAGELVRETTTVVTQVSPSPGYQPGGYL
jgi:hypothetical protein